MFSETDIDIRRLSTRSFEEAVRLWNEGFEGYFLDMKLTLNTFLARVLAEGISPEYSLVALVEGRAAGFVLNGIRTQEGRRVGWNAGTGVAPEFRRRGVGRALIKAALDVYREQGVERATLEAIRENEKAIALYSQFGYKIIDGLIFLEHEGKPDPRAFGVGENRPYVVRRGAPCEAAELSFYKSASPWQAQWQSVYLHNGESLIISDASGHVAGYALYKRKIDEHGQLTGVVLYQCEASPERSDREDIVACALREVYAPLDAPCRRITYNLSQSNEDVQRILRRCGFKTYVEQVHMMGTPETLRA